MFRGKESSNRIELSRLVQDLLNFGVLGFLRLWGWGVDGCGWGVVVSGWGVTPHTAHVHACTRTRVKHDNFMQMAAPIGGIPGNSLCHMHMCVCMQACVCMCMCVGHPLTTPHPPPPGGDPQNHSKFNST